MPENSHNRLTIEAAQDGGYWVVGREKVVLFAGDLDAVTRYVQRTIRRVATSTTSIPASSIPNFTIGAVPMVWGGGGPAQYQNQH